MSGGNQKAMPTGGHIAKGEAFGRPEGQKSSRELRRSAKEFFVNQLEIPVTVTLYMNRNGREADGTVIVPPGGSFSLPSGGAQIVRKVTVEPYQEPTPEA